jgi:hypothetical protein
MEANIIAHAWLTPANFSFDPLGPGSVTASKQMMLHENAEISMNKSLS